MKIEDFHWNILFYTGKIFNKAVLFQVLEKSGEKRTSHILVGFQRVLRKLKISLHRTKF